MSERPTFACVLYARCEPCLYGQCPGGPHDWAGPDDIAYAEETGQPSPVGQRCGCSCVDEPAVDDEPPWGIDEPIDATPCPECGAEGACAWDADGRPLIHAAWDDDSEDRP